MKLRILFIVSFVCFSVLTLSAQQRVITGQVSDADEPLMAATVAVLDDKGNTLNGTTTNLNGQFTLSVPSQATHLKVSYISYETQTVTLREGVSHYAVSLRSDAKKVGEVVVTGYQKIDRRKLSAATTTINIDEESVGAVKNIDQALAGQIAGLAAMSTSGAPGAPLKLRIRGTASINGTQEPLWVLDGIPLDGTDIPAMEDLKDIDNIYQTSIAGLNPSDIETITVLKDAAATAIYGARAANGVIVITTKNGKVGKTSINFNAKMTYGPKTDISRLNLLNSAQKIDLELALLASDFTFRENKGGVAKIISDAGLTNAYKQGGWNALSGEAQAAINQLRGIDTDWNDILFRSVFNQEYNLSVSGGSDRANYYTSVGYYDEQGNVTGVKNNRFNLAVKTNFKMNKRLTIGASVFANQRNQRSYLTDYNGFTNPVYYSRLANPYMTAYDAAGNYVYDTNVQGKEDSSLDFNIFEERANGSNKRKDQQLMAIFDAELKLMPGLKLTSQLGLQFDNYDISKYAGENTFAMRKEKLFATYAFPDGKRSILPDGGAHKVTEFHNYQWTWKAMAEFAKDWNKINEIEVMLGTEVRHAEARSLYSVAYGYDNRTLTSQPVIFPTETMAEQYPLHQETHAENAFVSWFATASYTLRHRYTLGGSIRFDGSDVFGVAKKYRYLPLYSVSGLWRVSEEPFMKRVKAVNNLAIRASYGLQGNIDKNTSPYLIGTFDRVVIIPGNTETVISAETAPNSKLRWEKTQNVNAGIDMAFLNNAITLSFDYYFRHSTDLIGMRMLPLETGFSSTTINWATMDNHGFEIALGTRNFDTRDFKWTTNLNLGFNKNKILRESVAENATYPGREGYPVGAIFAYKTDGLDSEGYPLFVGKDGQKLTAKEFLQLNNHGGSTLTAEEQRNLYTYMGTSDPKVSGGFINHFEYRNWSLGINCLFNFGMKVRVQPSYSPANYDRGLNTNADILNRWTAENPTGQFARLMVSSDRPAEYIRYSEYNLYNMLDTWVRSSNYFRCQSIRLGYKFPTSLIRRAGMSSVSLSLEARNLFVIASDYGNFLDPETMGNPYAQPIPKSFILGLNIGF
ncbi:MAG: SusC/RagA family TonB-linked outer membrane protein [Prevotella sp.]|nr:SusC/RagA family TonB-linked outer membrane protein [Prevotella sp.]